MTLFHLYFALAAIAGLAWFGAGVRTLAVRRVRIGGYARQGVAAFVLGAFTVVAGGLCFNYGLINFLSPPPDIHKGLAMILLFVGLTQSIGLALAEIVHLIARRFKRKRS
jgi:hypothetical protein